jgi:glycosyltransferase involved in cell wall biosynthesis
MGAVTFSLDSRLVKSLKETLPLTTFVETGTFKGDTVEIMLSFFDNLISFELSPVLCKEAAERFSTEKKVQIIQGNSGDLLSPLSESLTSQSTLYWLDAHWCVADNTSGEQSQCPLLQEIRGIGKLNAQSIILIDDARLFLAPPPKPHDVGQWPRFDHIVRALYALSQQHELMVINDIIAFYPAAARDTFENYARFCGVDWLRASQSLSENTGLRSNLEIKEAALQRLHEELVEKEKVIQILKIRNDRFKRAVLAIPGARLAMRSRRKMREMFRPRLGNLNQYDPCTLTAVTKFAPQKKESSLKFSIVTPSYGQGDYIESTLQSVLEQDYPKIEYFVQDGGSQDDTVSVLNRYDTKLSGWASEPDTGQSQAINRGFSHTDGEIMAWLNSDDLLLPGALSCVADYFNAHPEVDVVYGNRLLIDKNGMEIGRWMLPGHNSKILSWVDYIPQETMFWRRRIWDKVGGHIDETFRFAMDWDLLVRFRDAGANIAHIPRFLGAFRIHDQQKTSAVMNKIGNEEMGRIRERIFGRVPSQIEIRKAVLPFLLQHLAVDMIYRFKKNFKSRAL